MTEGPTFRLSDDERAAFARDGYVIRHDVFTPAEVDDIKLHTEDLIADLIRDRKSKRFKVGSYVFEPDMLRGVYIKWEGDTDQVHGIEPVAHLSKPLADWGMDRRLVDPMIDVIDTPEPSLFTEKINLKRPQVGGPNPLHQDYPYWIDPADDAEKVATAIVYLDDSDRGNGCTWVVPGSHTQGMWKTRTDMDEFGQNEIDASAYPDIEIVPVEVKAGAVVMFGSYLVHQSTPNTSDRHRRTILYSYQPAGHTTMIEGWRKRAAEAQAAKQA